jgi:hypothetical protein
MDRLNIAENDHLLKENASLRKQFTVYHSKNKLGEYEDFLAALTISEIQRERLSFLTNELTYVEQRKQKLLEEEKKTQSLKSLESQQNLEKRLEEARQKRFQLECELENLNKTVNRQLIEMKYQSAKQNGNFLSNL